MDLEYYISFTNALCKESCYIDRNFHSFTQGVILSSTFTWTHLSKKKKYCENFDEVFCPYRLTALELDINERCLTLKFVKFPNRSSHAMIGVFQGFCLFFWVEMEIHHNSFIDQGNSLWGIQLHKKESNFQGLHSIVNGEGILWDESGSSTYGQYARSQHKAKWATF